MERKLEIDVEGKAESHDVRVKLFKLQRGGILRKKVKIHPKEIHGKFPIDIVEFILCFSIANVLKNVKTKYVYGVAAMPKRVDGLEKINYMLIGLIRYSYTVKEKAKAQGISHLVYPRFTRVVPPRGLEEEMHPNEAYEILRNNELKDEQILTDVRKCIDAGRTRLYYQDIKITPRDYMRE